jgi:hypothetical protein
MTHDPNEPTLVCEECAWGAPRNLVEVAVLILPAQAGYFLDAVHCCACVQAHCACGGGATKAALDALIAAFGPLDEPDPAADYLHAAHAFEAMHESHRVEHAPFTACLP